MHWGPLLEQSHQVWKLHASVIGGCIAAAFIAAPHFLTLSEGQALLCIGLGTFAAFIGCAIMFVGLRCPACGSRWMWRAAKQPQAGWLLWLREQRVCPACGRAPVPSNNRWRGP
jgi:hypothetical protein